jgi:hypothetical protein
VVTLKVVMRRSILPVVLAFSEEPVTISNIVADPETFSLKQGHHPRGRGPVKSWSLIFFHWVVGLGTYTFLLEDDARTVPCWMGQAQRVWSAPHPIPPEYRPRYRYRPALDSPGIGCKLDCEKP